MTTQMVLTEAFNAMARSGEGGRRLVAQLMEDLENDPDVEVIPQTEAQFRASVERYATRSDQSWSLTDCASFLVMEERDMAEALAYDRDFEQAGFVALLREGARMTGILLHMPDWKKVREHPPLHDRPDPAGPLEGDAGQFRQG